MRVGAWTGLSPLFVGTVFVLASTLVAALVFYQLVRLDHSAAAGRDAAFFLLIFPSSLFLYVPYTEAVLVMLAIGSFYLARKGHWALACAAAGLGSAVRNPGIFIGPALAVEYLAAREWDWRKIRPDALWLLLAPAGLIAYMVYLQVEFGDALAFYHWQLNPERLETIATRGGFPDFIPSLIDSVRVIFVTQSMDERVGNAAGLAAILLFAALLPLMFIMRVRLSYIVFSALTVLSPLFTGRLLGSNRFVLAAFPMFIVLALLGERYPALRAPWIVASLTLLQVSAVRFATYHVTG
jgi:hypothetical protein